MPVKFLEEFEGIGKLYRGHDFLLEVVCHFDVYEEYIEAPGHAPAKGLQTVLGRILKPDASSFFELLGEELTLRLQDGRQLDLYIRDSDGLLAARTTFYRPEQC